MLNKRAFIILLLLTISNVVSGQFLRDFKTMGHVYKDWLNRGACDTLYYTEKVSPQVLDETIKLISSRKTFPLYDLYIGTETEPLVITPAERSYLTTELKKLKEFKWPVKLFPGSKRISQSEISSVFKVTDGFSEEKYHSCSLIYSFSKPIFFRNGTICLYIDQEIFGASNTRLMTQFLSRINGEWEEYANVYVEFGKEGSPEKSSADTLISKIIQSQIEHIALSKPEKSDDFGRRVFSNFQSQDNSSFSSLFPTLEQRTVIAKQMAIPTRNRSPKTLTSGQALAILNFNYECLNVLDTAKALKINWAKAIYSGVKQYEVVLPMKNSEGKQMTITNLNVLFTESSRKFQLQLEGVYLIDGSWKTVSVTGLREVKKE